VLTTAGVRRGDRKLERSGGGVAGRRLGFKGGGAQS
jgi:hypothetical protein